MLATALLLLSLSSPARAEDANTVDLSDQFPSQCRSQDNVGACHSFAAVALLEAALKRREKEEVDLSDADLFVQGTIGVQGVRPAVARAVSLFNRNEEGVVIDYLDGGWTADDLDYALAHGVAERDAFSWDDFREAYNGYRFSYAKSCRAAVARDAAESKDCDDEGSHLKEFLDLLATPAAREQIAQGLSHDGHDLGASRKRTLGRLSGFKPGHRSFPFENAKDSGDRARCLSGGGPALQAVLTQFAARRPASICFELKGFAAWGEYDGQHCVALTGYVSEKTGRYRFQTRNSWLVLKPTRNPLKRLVYRMEERFVNPDMPDDEFCRVSRVDWLEP